MVTKLLFLLGLSTVFASECPSGWNFDVSTSYCYLVSTRTFSFNDAQSYCSSQGGNLVSITSSTENDAIQKMTSNVFLPPWTGANLNSNSNRWQWIDGQFFSYQYFAPGEPSSAGSCGVLRSNGLAAAPCYSLQPAICMQAPALCNGGSFTGYSGNFTSPGYPVQYYNNLKCYYLITSPSAKSFITITFDPYLVEAIYDSVTIFDGNSTSRSHQIARKSGNADDKDTYESSSNQMTVVFQTDAIGTDKGFFASWKSKPNYPDVIQNGDRGQVFSANYPSIYDPFTEQNYYITVPDNFRVNMTFDSFQTESGYDTVVIYDSPVLGAGNMIANVSGIYSSRFSYQSTTPTISMRFRTDGQLQLQGWHMSWNYF